jgi:hypothetical protein
MQLLCAIHEEITLQEHEAFDMIFDKTLGGVV